MTRSEELKILIKEVTEQIHGKSKYQGYSSIKDILYQTDLVLKQAEELKELKEEYKRLNP